jgi:two-component system cell cycle sensor histidine kinase/response regulator CckA
VLTKILIAEDDQAVRELMSRLLMALGFHVLMAGNGQEAVDLFRSTTENINLIITDIRMPVMDGYEAVRQIKAMKPEIRVIFMSSSDATGPEGAAFLAKPFTIAEVQECIQNVLADLPPTALTSR